MTTPSWGSYHHVMQLRKEQWRQMRTDDDCPECGHPTHYPKECTGFIELEGEIQGPACDCILFDTELALDVKVDQWDSDFARFYDFLHGNDALVRGMAEHGDGVAIHLFTFNVEKAIKLLEMIGGPVTQRSSIAGEFVTRSFGPHEIQLYLPMRASEPIQPPRSVHPEVQSWIDAHNEEPDVPSN